ncbi:hypothetical protein BVC80_8639g17 [Macleaya cordata]|uniref:RNase H type-1 domain-containing protein n=1 Tax=Macleaya cordata TaxID=56857 RepID=A0A200QJU1_MACCD|nr:hypothetical protein BVC80_8639g17 [Macleaya cordata]
MHNSVENFCILSSLGIGGRHVKFQVIKECRWIPLPFNQIRISCDGAARGNLGTAGAGIIIRDHNSLTIATMPYGLGYGINYMTEVDAIMMGLEWVVSNNHLHV